jgi:UDP-N-acetylmuramate--alanine ligase
MVVEADESDRSFLRLTPAVAVITNIDQEHLEAYRDFEDLQQAFVTFANKVPFYGAVVACADDERLRQLLPSVSRRVVTYGLEGQANYIGVDVSGAGFDWRCTVVRRGRDARTAGQTRPTDAAPATEELGELLLHVPGRHNLQNALAAVAVGMDHGVPFRQIAAALEGFRGAERRFESHGEGDGVLVVEDYGHHPTEIASVISAARGALDRRILVVFQPHRFTRTRGLLDRFGPALSGADEIVLTDIYAAGEDPVPGVTIDLLAEHVRSQVSVPVHVVRNLADIPASVANLARRGDVVITLGAGSIGPMSGEILTALREREARDRAQGGE